MLFPEEDSPQLKTWIVKRIEKTSDADAEVLAEYILALLKHDGDKETIRKLCEAEIPDFLREDPKVFLDDLFQTIAYKSYLPGAPPPPKPRPVTERAPTGPSADKSNANGFTRSPPAHPRGSRKRGRYEDLDAPPPEDGGQDYGSRLTKNPRRNARSRGGGGGVNGSGRDDVNMQLPDFAQMQLPQFDPRHHMEAFMQMGMPMNGSAPAFSAGHAGLPRTRGGPGRGRGQSRRSRRCRDFDARGFCDRGTTCMFEHGNENGSMPPPAPQTDSLPYDSSSGSLPAPTFTGVLPQPYTAPPDPRHSPIRRREGRGGSKKNPSRAPFSAEGAVHDRAKTTIVVENIPEEYFSEDQVREFFSQFGEIVEISMRPYKHLAIVKYDSWGPANAAYQSPKVIFDNRFVRVFWLKDGVDTTAPSAPGGRSAEYQRDAFKESETTTTEEPEIDLEEFQRKQEEAQKQYQEKEAKRLEIEQRRQEIDQKQQALQEKYREETQRLQAKLAEKNGDDTGSGSSGTDMLRQKLALLEQEAKILGIDTSAEAEDVSVSTHSSSRGGFARGRGGSFRGRAQPWRGSRGSYRGQGDRHATYAQFSIDNRPKKIAITGVDFTVPEKDESLRHFLLSLGEFESVQPSSDVTHVSFQDRKTAEKLYYSLNGKELPGVEGKLDLSWVSTPLPPVQSSSSATAAPSAPAGQTDAPEYTTNGSGTSKDAPPIVHTTVEDMDYEQPFEDDDAWA